MKKRFTDFLALALVVTLFWGIYPFGGPAEAFDNTFPFSSLSGTWTMSNGTGSALVDGSTGTLSLNSGAIKVTGLSANTGDTGGNARINLESRWKLTVGSSSSTYPLEFDEVATFANTGVNKYSASYSDGTTSGRVDVTLASATAATVTQTETDTAEGYSVNITYSITKTSASTFPFSSLSGTWAMSNGTGTANIGSNTGTLSLNSGTIKVTGLSANTGDTGGTARINMQSKWKLTVGSSSDTLNLDETLSMAFTYTGVNKYSASYTSGTVKGNVDVTLASATTATVTQTETDSEGSVILTYSMKKTSEKTDDNDDSSGCSAGPGWLGLAALAGLPLLRKRSA